MKKVAIVGAGIVGATAAYYLFLILDTAKQPRLRQELLVPGFLNDATRLGIRWRAWELIFM